MQNHYIESPTKPVIIAGIVVLKAEPRCNSGEDHSPTSYKAIVQKLRQITLGFCAYKNTMAHNPRHSNGNLRRKHRARLKAMAAPCGICKGRLGPIHYDEPSDSKHPLSFVIDEIIPVSRWAQYGYNSPEEAAQDWDNLQAAHWVCNQMKGNKIGVEAGRSSGENKTVIKYNIADGDW